MAFIPLIWFCYLYRGRWSLYFTLTQPRASAKIETNAVSPCLAVPAAASVLVTFTLSVALKLAPPPVKNYP